MVKQISLKPSLIQIPAIKDPRGNLSFIEEDRHFPFKIQSLQWIYQISGEEKENGLAYIEDSKLYIALSGSLTIYTDDGSQKNNFILNRSYLALYVPNLIWHELKDFASGTTLLKVSSGIIKGDDLITDYQTFIKHIKKNV